jgi:spore coat protein I
MFDNYDNLDKLAFEVLKNYTLVIYEVCTIQNKPSATVWKVKTQDGMLCLKRLKQPYHKVLFYVNAQNHIKESGGNVPKIITDKNGELIVIHNNQLFFLCEWLHGKELNFANFSNLHASITSLAGFHASSKDCHPPVGFDTSFIMAKLMMQYNSMTESLSKWKEASKEIPLPYHMEFMKHIDSILVLSCIAKDLLLNFGNINFNALDSISPVLSLKNFSKEKIIFTEKGVFIIDLMGAIFDFPVKEIRRMIGKHAEVKRQWSTEDISLIVEYYESINPLTKVEKELLYIDLFYPHWFFSLVRNLFHKNKPVKPSDIEQIANLELSKANAIIPLLIEQVSLLK